MFQTLGGGGQKPLSPLTNQLPELPLVMIADNIVQSHTVGYIIELI